MAKLKNTQNTTNLPKPKNKAFILNGLFAIKVRLAAKPLDHLRQNRLFRGKSATSIRQDPTTAPQGSALPGSTSQGCRQHPWQGIENNSVPAASRSLKHQCRSSPGGNPALPYHSPAWEQPPPACSSRLKEELVSIFWWGFIPALKLTSGPTA